MRSCMGEGKRRGFGFKRKRLIISDLNGNVKMIKGIEFLSPGGKNLNRGPIYFEKVVDFNCIKP